MARTLRSFCRCDLQAWLCLAVEGAADKPEGCASKRLWAGSGAVYRRGLHFCGQQCKWHSTRPLCPVALALLVWMLNLSI